MVRRLAVALAAYVLAFSLALSAPPSADAVEYPCAAGYVQIEDQAWWQDKTGEAWPGRHIHQQVCWPTGVVNGTLELPIRILLHAQPTGARIIRVRIADGGGSYVWSQSSGFPAFNGGDISFTVTARFDASKLSTGIHEMRMATVVRQPSGVDQFVSSGHPLYVRSTSGGATSRNYHEARGWYPKFEYLNARTKTPLANFREMTAGEAFHTQCASPSGADATACGVWLDPDAHAGRTGRAILSVVNGESSRTATFPDWATPGLHKVAIRADSRRDLGGVSNGTNSGVFVITVLVP